MQAFPDTPDFRGFNAPTRLEATIHGLEIEGELPEGLEGTFFRVQPDPQWPPRLGWDISLNGDGLVTAFEFGKGRVNYRSRYVRTDKFKAELAAGKALFGMYRNPYTDDPSVAGLSRGTANTNLLWHGGRLLALKEDSHPVEIAPRTLETIGNYDYGGTLKSLTLSAHPKIDHATGELYTYGYAAKGEATLDIAYYIVGRDGRIRHETWFEAPYGCMIHDFAISQNHVLFPITPLCSDLDRLKAGGIHFHWHRERASYLGVLPREGRGEDIRWIAGDNCHATHTMNAWEEGTRIHYDTPTGQDCVFPFFPANDGSPWDGQAAAPRLTRWTVDLARNDQRIEREVLTPIQGDFPRIDDRYAGRPYTRGWIMGYDPDLAPGQGRPGGLATNAIVEHDLVTGKRHSYWVGEGCSPQEPQFVPRNPDAPEADGWLLMVRHRVKEMLSDLVVLDTRDISAGPVAVVKLPIRLRRGLHGTWVSAAELG